jgi:chromate transporter
MGITARGRIGGLLAGLGFMLPGFLLMLACGWAYEAFIAGRPGLSGILLGAQVAVLAVILRATQRIGVHILIGRAELAYAAIAAMATLANVPFWVPLIAIGVARALPWRTAWAMVLVTAVSLLGWAFLPEMSFQPHPDAGSIVTVLALFAAGLKGGLLTFGGAYTAIPYVRADTVGRGWLSDGQFLDGVAIANLLPAPLVIFATFAGYIAGGLVGALVITAGMFLPAFAFSMVFFERVEQVIEQPRLHRVLDGVAAGAVGIIAATLVQLALATSERLADPLPALPIFTMAALAAWRLKGPWVTPAIVALGALAGALVLG